MAYKSVVQDLRDYLSGFTTAPDTVIETPFEGDQIITGAMQEFRPSFNGLQVILKEASGIANPKWLRDSWTVSIQVIGENSAKYSECESLIGDVTFTLVGSNTIYVGNRAFVQMTSNQLPQFVGYLDNSKPLFSSTINFVVEGLTDEYNRKALC